MMDITAAKFVLLVVATLSLLLGQSQSQHAPLAPKGEWKLLKRSIGISAMHMALLPSGHVAAFDRTDFGRSLLPLPPGKPCRSQPPDCSAHSILFDPRTRAGRALTLLTDTFCSSGALSPGGTLIQTGGDRRGNRTVRYLRPCPTCDWLEHDNALLTPRWYASDQALPDGRVIVLGGQGAFNYEFVPKHSESDHKLFDLPFLEQTKDKWGNNLYPFLHLSPDGYLFVFANTKSILLDYVNNRVVKYYPDMPGGVSRNYPSTGSSVLLPLQLKTSGHGDVKAEVFICGGAKPGVMEMAKKKIYWPASPSCGRLVITDASPEWEMETMPMRRIMGDMVLLPTGDVLIINGAAYGSAGWYDGRVPVRWPVIYRKDVRRFEVLRASAIPRMYHSSALLLPDARVLVGGSNPNPWYNFSGVPFPTELSLEAFSPPYLWVDGVRAHRPRITGIEPGTEVGYGEWLSVCFNVKTEHVKVEEKVQVTMVAPAFATHSFSMNQRVLELDFGRVRRVRGKGHVVEGFSPANSALAPPGYYMLFVVYGGVPSHAKWVQIS
ncbi:aldehyde oxidase GLOX1-like [Typha angustifolia]|uniref:aldehyde oxidase GLOX1-like n=1 Tax=Typha angustifolia TaxID=59011 RepID=UPI003C2B50FC